MVAILYPSYTAGQRLTAASLQAGQSMIAYKTANTDRANATMADDPDLQFSLAANAVYAVEFFMHYAALSAAGFVTLWRIPTGAAGTKGIQGPGAAAVDANANNISMRSGVHGLTTLTVSYGTRNSATNQCLAYEECLLTTASAGIVAIQWAQLTTNATAARMAVGSWARALRIS